MCKYCDYLKYGEDDDSDSYICTRDLKGEVYEGMEMMIDGGNKLVIFVVAPIMCGYTKAYAHYEKSIEINYCPMCGRKLGDK